MQHLSDTPSNHLTLSEVLTRLAKADAIDGLALFGTQATGSANPVSDYDLLILVKTQPEPVFQMLTHIDGRMADVIFIETSLVDTLLAERQPVAATSFARLFLQKMLYAQVVYDASARLQQAQTYAQTQQRAGRLLLPTSESDLYSTWFWINHRLFHLKRMAQADDPDYQTAVDLMLASGLGEICRPYYRVRHLAWEGEKRALRYLHQHDPAFLAVLRTCLAERQRDRKILLYEQLVTLALAPIGSVWQAGLTAVSLRDVPHTSDRLARALRFWQALLEEGSG